MRQLPTLDARVQAAWQTQVAAAANAPGLLPALVQRRQELLPRFAACYTQLRALPRRVRRAPQRQWEQTPARLTPLLALGEGTPLCAPLPADGATGPLICPIHPANNDACPGSRLGST